MFNPLKFRRILFCLPLLASSCVAVTPAQFSLSPAVQAAETETQLPVSKAISLQSLEKYKTISVKVDDHGKEVSYSGVPVRTVLAEMIPEMKMETEPDWKAVARRKLVVEVLGADGYPGLVTAAELAFNTAGDRYVLALQKDGKPIASGVQLVCKSDDAQIRWIKKVVSMQVAPIAAK